MRFIQVLVLSVGIVAAWVGGSTASLAATVNISFSGTIKNIVDPGHLTSYSTNDPISGTLTIGPVTDAPTSSFPGSSTYTAGAQFNFGTIADAGKAEIITEGLGGGGSLGYFGITFQALPLVKSSLLIDFFTSSTSAVPLQTLSNLPHDLAGILSYLGGPVFSKHGGITGGPDLAHQFSLAFNLTSITLSVSPAPAPTPIPATLPLLASSLLGMVFFARRRKANAAV